MQCTIDECRAKHYALGRCRRHYDAWRRPPLPKRSNTQRFWANVDKRFWAKVDKGNHRHSCWVWTGKLNTYGYGRLTIDRKEHFAHRVSYEIAKGKIPNGLEI